MQVWKFGGTSVGKPERMKSIRQLITEDGQPKIVVLSALSGSTNTLLSISESLNSGNQTEAKVKATELRAHYDQFLTELYSTPAGLGKGQAIVEKEFNFIDSLIATAPYTGKQEKEMVALGELLSTQIFEAFLQEEGVSSALLPALDFMVIDEDNEPVLSVIEQKLAAVLAPVKGNQIFVTQGFICRNPSGEVDNLKRGGSDYTASLIGGAIQAEEVQIWTDIDGMHNNDPRIVKNTFPIR
ncbi:MAG: Aspartate kinase, partial [Bacteroidota bacterium]